MPPSCKYILSKRQEKGKGILEKEHKKMGRPIKNNEPRTNKLTLRLSSNELNDIEECSKKLEVSRTDVIVMGIKKLKEDL